MPKSSSKQRSMQSYTPEFRLNAIRLAQSGKGNVTQTARDLGVPLATLHSWVRKAAKGEWSLPEENVTAVKVERPASGSKTSISQKLHDQLAAEQRKSAELEKQLRRVMQEREILKKAMEYCLDVPK